MSETEQIGAIVKRKCHKSTLTPAKKKFARIYANTDNGTRAVKEAYKDNQYSSEVAGVKATRLLKNDSVLHEIDIQKKKLEIIANKAVNRIDDLVDSDNEQIATTNAWKVIEQVHGKAVTKNLSINTTIDIEQMLNAMQ